MQNLFEAAIRFFLMQNQLSFVWFLFGYRWGEVIFNVKLV